MTTRWTPRSPLEGLIQIDAMLADVLPRYGSARNALLEVQPGLSGRPAGNGEPGGGRGAALSTVVEQAALTGGAVERRSMARLDELPSMIEADVCNVLRSLGSHRLPSGDLGGARSLAWSRWAVRVVIESVPLTDCRLSRSASRRLHVHVVELTDLVNRWTKTPKVSGHRSVDLATDDTEQWCRSCLRVGNRWPRDDRYPTDGVCRWCGDFHAAQGFWPTLELLDARRDGRRITEAMVTAARPRKSKHRRRR